MKTFNLKNLSLEHEIDFINLLKENKVNYNELFEFPIEYQKKKINDGFGLQIFCLTSNEEVFEYLIEELIKRDLINNIDYKKILLLNQNINNIILLADKGLFLEELKNHKCHKVRLSVVKQGYKIEEFYNDYSLEIRCYLASHIDNPKIFLNDSHPDVKIELIKKGTYKEEWFFDEDGRVVIELIKLCHDDIKKSPDNYTHLLDYKIRSVKNCLLDYRLFVDDLVNDKDQQIRERASKIIEDSDKIDK